MLGGWRKKGQGAGPFELTTTEVTKEEMKGYDVERNIPLADVAPITKDAEPVLPDVVPVASPADADAIQAISEVFPSASPVSEKSKVRRCGAPQCHSQ